MQTSLPTSDDLRPALQPPRFGLGALLGGVAVCSVLFAITHYYGTYGAAIAVLFGLCILAHVVGNSLGVQLRRNGDCPLRPNGEPGAAPYTASRPRASDFAPPTRLRQRRALGRHVSILTGGGACLGAALGYAGVAWIADESTPWSVLIVGAIAAAVLGGIWTFLAIGFFQVTLREFLDPQSEGPT